MTLAIISLCGIVSSATSTRAGNASGAAISQRPAADDSAPDTCTIHRASLRSGVVDRRQATWHWQDELEIGHTAASFAERWVRGCEYLRWLKGRWAGRADEHWKLYASLTDVKAAVCFVFKGYCSQAMAVVDCESSGSTRAHNGQYLGLFQMGSGERARYGDGDSPLEQARAAYGYFVASGRDWSPWSCRP